MGDRRFVSQFDFSFLFITPRFMNRSRLTRLNSPITRIISFSQIRTSFLRSVNREVSSCHEARVPRQSQFHSVQQKRVSQRITTFSSVNYSRHLLLNDGFVRSHVQCHYFFGRRVSMQTSHLGLFGVEVIRLYHRVSNSDLQHFTRYFHRYRYQGYCIPILYVFECFRRLMRLIMDWVLQCRLLGLFDGGLFVIRVFLLLCCVPLPVRAIGKSLVFR